MIKATEYHYIDDELTVPMQAETLAAYSQHAADYARLALTPSYLEAAWKSFFSPALELVRSFNADKPGKILVAGDGILRDSFVFLLLSKFIEVYAFDGSEGMLQEGRARINWTTTLMLSTLVYLQDRENANISNGNGLIQGIISIMNSGLLSGNTPPGHSGLDSRYLSHISNDDTINIGLDPKSPVLMPFREFLRLGDKPFNTIFRNEIVDTISKRLHAKQGMLQDRVFGDVKVDLAIAMATLQHLRSVPDSEGSLSELMVAIDNLIFSLNQGGTLHFNVRLDMQPINREGERPKGRVFVDDVLTAKRYYMTLSWSEIMELKNQLERKYGNSISIKDGGATPHPDGQKPWFYDIFVTKLS